MPARPRPKASAVAAPSADVDAGHAGVTAGGASGLASHLRSRWADAAFGRQAQVRRFTRRAAIASIPYAIEVLTVFHGMAQGWVSMRHGAFLLLGLCLTVGGLWTLLRSGWSQHLSDPSLGLPQALLCTGWCSLGYCVFERQPQTQMLILMLAMSVAMGALYLDVKRMMIVSGAVLVEMGAAVVLATHRSPARLPASVEWMNWGIVLACIPTMVLIGIQLSAMRSRLRTQRIQLERACARVRELAIKDELTGVYNRHYAGELFAHHIQQHEAGREEVSLALLDIDHFKHINDRHGHPVGDDVLRRFARQALSTLRESDIVVRWGGEEFALICPGQSIADTCRAVDRLRRVLRDLDVTPSVPGLTVTFSAGIAAHRRGETLDQTVERADAALYAAKSAGRDRTVVDGA